MTGRQIWVPEGWSVEQAWEHYERKTSMPFVQIPAGSTEVEKVPGVWVDIDIDEEGNMTEPWSESA